MQPALTAVSLAQPRAHSRRSEAGNAPALAPAPVPAPDQTTACIALSVLAAHLRGQPVAEAVASELAEPGVRAEVAALLRRVAWAVEPEPSVEVWP